MIPSRLSFPSFENSVSEIAPYSLVRFQTGEVAERSEAGEKEVGAAFDRYESLQVVNARTQRIGLHGKYFVALTQISNQRINLAVKATEDRIVNPRLLYEFKLSFDVGVET